MKKYFFYSATGSGVVSLQFPGVATSVGVAQDGRIYQTKLTYGLAIPASLTEGITITETALIAAIVAAFSGAKVVMEIPSSKVVTLMN